MDSVDDLLERGIVSQGRQKWRVHEDGVLANEMQNCEFQQHYSWNRRTRRTVREDVNLARVVQTEEDLMHDEKRRRYIERMESKIQDEDENECVEEGYFNQMEHEEEDEVLARALQEAEKQKYKRHQEKRRIKKLKEERRRLSAAAMAIAAAMDTSSGGAVEADLNTFKLNNLTQEQQDELLAKKLQEQESLYRLNVMSYQEEAAELDDRLAKVIAELDKLRLRRYERREREERSLREQSSTRGEDDHLPSCSSASTDNASFSSRHKKKEEYLEITTRPNFDKNVSTSSLQTSAEPQRYAFAGSGSPLISSKYRGNPLLRLDEKILSGAANGGLIILAPTNSDKSACSTSSACLYENVEMFGKPLGEAEIASTPFGPIYNIAATLDPTFKPLERIQPRNRSHKFTSSEPLRGDRRRSVDSKGAKS